MSELNYPENSSEWARRRGIARKCKHGWHDPNIDCPECKKEKEEEEKRRLKETQEREEKKLRLKAAFDNVVWPDDVDKK